MRADGEVHETSPESDGGGRDKPKASRHPVEPLEKSCKPGSATVETLLAIQTELDKGKF